MMQRISTLQSESRREWKAATLETRGEWRAAYEREPTPFSIAIGSRETFADGVADYITGTQAVAA